MRCLNALMALLLATAVTQANAADEPCVSRYEAGYVMTQLHMAVLIAKSADICPNAGRKQQAKQWISQTMKRYEHCTTLITAIKQNKSHLETGFSNILKSSLEGKGRKATCAEIRKEIDQHPLSDFR